MNGFQNLRTCIKKNQNKTVSEIAKITEKGHYIKEIDIGDCRRQGYDNGANKSGRIKGSKFKP